MKTNHESIIRALATLSFALCLFLWAVPVKADTLVIDFSGHGGGAVLSFNQTTHVLTGSGIVIQWVSGYNTPLNQGDHTVFGALSFTTPALSFSPDVNEWLYSGAEAGTFAINGKVPDAGINSVASLLLGHISYFAYTPFSSVRSVVFALGNDTKDANLLAYFGVTTGTEFAFDGSMTFAYSSPNAWYSSSDIENSAIPPPTPSESVPEPTSLILLGIGLLATYGCLGDRRNN